MTLLDSSGWLAYFAGESHGPRFGPYAKEPGRLVPTIVVHEVYRVLKRERDLDAAMEGVAAMTDESQGARVVDLDRAIALHAGDVALAQGLATADAVIYATAQLRNATLVTSDAHFEGLPGVEYIPGP